LQCTWQLADAKGHPTREWQTAEVEIHNPTWLWGDKPDEKGQYLSFRYQGKADARPWC